MEPTFPIIHVAVCAQPEAATAHRLNANRKPVLCLISGKAITSRMLGGL